MAKVKNKEYDLNNPDECTQYWTKKAQDSLLGRRILRVEYMSSKECNSYGWWKRPVTFILDNGTRIIAMQDDEGNDGGVLTCLGDKEELLPVLSVREDISS